MTTSEKWRIEKQDGYALVYNQGGAVLGVRGNGSAHLVFHDGFAFKDLNGNGVLDPYKDWRLPVEERVRDLAARMSVEQIAGLMLYSSHQSISRNNPLAELAYPGRKKTDNRENPWDLSDDQKEFLDRDNLRHVLVAMIDDTSTAAKWNNLAQAFVEARGLGIPINISSDPRHTPAITAEFDLGSGKLSVWPDHLGLAATFDPGLVRKFGEVASREYRALGITTALSPQIDLATEPRWNRFSGTFGESSLLSADMARAYCDGFQTSPPEAALPGPGAPGWGSQSVNAMVKHWPGGGSGEGGRDAHYGYGKFAVYPAGNIEEHLKPFIMGAFKLEGETGAASAVMPYYTVSWGLDAKYGENVGNSYSKYIITDLLRTRFGYDGVICTDWLITADAGDIEKMFFGKCWGVENLSIAERHYKILMAGVDQFGGNNDIGPVLEAYRMGCTEHGEVWMRERFELSARRLLRNIFRTGLFENPYLNPEESGKITRRADFVELGYQAQLKSAVLLKNKGIVLPVPPKTKVYIPDRYLPERHDWFGHLIPACNKFPINRELAAACFELTEDPGIADMALCFIESPKSLPYTNGQGYLPISLQYRPYTAAAAREKSIAGNGPQDNRGYRNKTNRTENENDLDMVLETRKLMGSKPVAVIVNTANPFVTAEFEKAADVILLHFGIQEQALLDLLLGVQEPSGLLPFQMPADMETVEAQAEDLSHDMRPHQDELGNKYDFGFGLNWKGVISDWRTKKYIDKGVTE
jgi:beta-glucosidase